jgi:hypothetical protein
MPGEKAAVTQGNLTDFRPDTENLNQGTERGNYALERSLREYGFARPVVAAADGTIIAGNHAYAKAGEIGMKKVIVVESEGEVLIVHKRTDLDASDPKARMLALADNRTSEINLQWDTSGLKEFAEETEQVLDFFSDAELELLSGVIEPPSYEPTLQPTQGATLTTDADVAAAQQRMTNSFDTAGDQNIVDVTCPHCSQAFGIDRASI